jgi:hypothetical protein
MPSYHIVRILHNLTNVGKRNVIRTSWCRAVGMRLYNQGRQKLKWKDSRSSNVQTHVQANVSKVGVKEGIKLGWSWKFGLDELDV